MKESQTVGRDINYFFSVKILYCTLAGRWWRRFWLQRSYELYSNRTFFVLL